jgi:hypothetical protein
MTLRAPGSHRRARPEPRSQYCCQASSQRLTRGDRCRTRWHGGWYGDAPRARLYSGRRHDGRWGADRGRPERPKNRRAAGPCPGNRIPCHGSASALAQAVRQPQPQSRPARLLRKPTTDVIPLDRVDATNVGRLLAASGTSDVVDAHVVICARGALQQAVTSDPNDLRALDPTLRVVTV